jgi:hypothetical protein
MDVNGSQHIFMKFSEYWPKTDKELKHYWAFVHGHFFSEFNSDKVACYARSSGNKQSLIFL